MTSWSLIDELDLLKAMTLCGLDWPDIAKRCGNRSPDDCERHYYKWFIDKPKLVDLNDLLCEIRNNFQYSSQFLCQGLQPDGYCRCADPSSTSSLLISQSENTKDKCGSVTKCDLNYNKSNDGEGIEVLKLNFIESSYSCNKDSTNFRFSFETVDFDNEIFPSDKLPELYDLSIFDRDSEIYDSNSNETEAYNSTMDICESHDFESNCLISNTSILQSTNETVLTDDSGEIVEKRAPNSSSINSERKKVCATDSLPIDKRNITYGVSRPRDSQGGIPKFAGKLAGFDANRTEFEVEYDNRAEEVLNSLHYELLLKMPEDDDDYSLVTELSLAVVQGYMHRLKERYRRRELISRFGLLDYSKISCYIKTVEGSFGKTFAKSFVLLKRLFSVQELDNFMEEYQCFNQLKTYLTTLCNYRQRGIRTLAASKLYEEMAKIRNEDNIEIQAIPQVKRLENGESVLCNLFRRPAPPIAVNEMPGYVELDKDEVDFCSFQRITPKSYLEYKKTLMNECGKRKGLKLAQARTLLKIDVNKTRKLYDLLLNKELIWKEQKMTDH